MAKEGRENTVSAMRDISLMKPRVMRTYPMSAFAITRESRPWKSIKDILN